MRELSISALVWDDFNENHIWERHQLTRTQVEAICFGDVEQIQVNITYGGRFLIVGPGQDGKLYAVVLGPEGENTFYPVSARRASKKECRDYEIWKADNSDE